LGNLPPEFWGQKEQGGKVQSPFTIVEVPVRGHRAESIRTSGGKNSA